MAVDGAFQCHLKSGSFDLDPEGDDEKTKPNLGEKHGKAPGPTGGQPCKGVKKEREVDDASAPPQGELAPPEQEAGRRPWMVLPNFSFDPKDSNPLCVFDDRPLYKRLRGIPRTPD